MTREEIKDKYREKVKNFRSNYCVFECHTNDCNANFDQCKIDFLIDQLADKDLLIDEVIKEIENARNTDYNESKFYYNNGYNGGIYTAIQIIKDKLKDK